jgi:Fe-Mn family superoxide dismutase
LFFSQDALEPKISKKTMDLHWGKHHQAYVTNLNGQIKGTELEGKPLTDIIAAGWNGGQPTPFFNNAGQVWNHDFFWASMSPTKSEE